MAEFCTVIAEEGAVTVIVIVGALPGARLARVQVTCPGIGRGALSQVQPDPEAETKVTSPGRVSTTLTF